MFATFLSDNWQQLIVTLVGVFVGALIAVLIGLYLLRVEGRHQQRQAEALLNERRTQLVRVLKRTVEQTRRVVCTIGKDIAFASIIVNVDVPTLEWLCVQEAATFADVPLREQMNQLRHELRQFDTLLTMLLRLDFDPMSRHATMIVNGQKVPLYGQVRPTLVEAIAGTAARATTSCDVLLSALSSVG
jgi:hypothetical protein